MIIKARLFHVFLSVISLSLAWLICSCKPLRDYKQLQAANPRYIERYIPRNFVYFKDITCREDANGRVEVDVLLRTNYSTPVQLVAKEKNQSPLVINETGLLKLTMQKRDSAILQRKLTIDVVSDGRVKQSRDLTILYAPRERYMMSGQSTPSLLIVRKYTDNEVPYSPYELSDYVMPRPSDEDIAFAKQQWGHLFSANDLPLEKAIKLHQAISSKLNPFQGVPSDSMLKAKPFKQFTMALEGKGKLWCSNWSDIFTYAAACFDIPTRIVGFRNPLKFENNIEVIIGEGHAFLEIYDAEKAQWFTHDLLFGLLYATYKGQLLNTQDLMAMINSEKFRKGIRLMEYDANTDKIKRVKFTKSTKAHLYYNEYKINQTVNYVKVK